MSFCNVESSTAISFGDNVRVLLAPETETMGIAGRVGQVYGHTTPSATGVAVIGTLEGEASIAINVQLTGYPETLWFAPALLEFIDHAPGTKVSTGGTSFVRDANGRWKNQSTK